MKTSTKAVLLSTLVFPGLGHLVVKSYWRAALLIVAALGAMYFVVAVATDRAMTVVDQIYSGQVPADAATITEMVANSSSGAGDSTASAAMFVLLACWLVGIVDSYRLGKSLDETAPGK